MSQVKKQYKWDLTSFFKNKEEWESCYKSYSEKIQKMKEFEGKLSDKNSILKCLKLLEELELDAGPLYIYASSLYNLDVSSSSNQELLNKIENLFTEQSVATSFIQPQLSEMSNDFLNSLLRDDDFQNYSKIIEDIIKEKEHVLDDKSEKLLSQTSLFSDSFSNIFSSFENGDLKFNSIENKNGKKIPMSQSLASIYLRENDSVLRENAYKELNGAFGRYNNFLTSNYLSHVKRDIFYSKARKFNSSLDKALFYEDVNSSVYSNLIKQVENNLKSEHKFFNLKKKFLKLKIFKTSDVYYNPLKNNKKYTFEEAFNIVCSALNILGDDYTNEITNLKNNDFIDVYPDKNKHNGAYETCCYGKNPLVLLNFSGKYNDISTLAHELGHAMHSYYSNKSQPIFKASYKIFLAEIASTVNELLLNRYMLDISKSDKEKLFYINEFLSTFHATIFRQTMFANFEDLAHNLVENNLPVSSKILNDEYLKLVKKYFGKGVKVLDCVKYEWSRIPHFYTSFYVYKYATGLISAINIVNNLTTGLISVDDYKKFLSSGCTKDPVSLLKIVKVDLNLQEAFENAFMVFNCYIKEFEKIINKK